MRYRSVAALNAHIASWIADLPRDIDLVVGIPRSGLLAGNLLALHLNVPLTDLDGFIAGRLLGTGERLRIADRAGYLSQRRRVLIVDDSVLSGTAMKRARTMIDEARLPHEVMYGAVYVDPDAAQYVHYFRELLPGPRCFEWNLMHHSCLSVACVDIDGVLCRDPTEEENDDGPRYLTFLSTVPALRSPTVPLQTLVTCRLEKYRGVTEAWLSRHRVQYKKLIMMPFANMKERRAANSYAQYKAEAYRTSNAELFVESSLKQALQIAELTKLPVLCIETQEVFYGDRKSVVMEDSVRDHSCDVALRRELPRSTQRRLWMQRGGRQVRERYCHRSRLKASIRTAVELVRAAATYVVLYPVTDYKRRLVASRRWWIALGAFTDVWRPWKT